MVILEHVRSAANVTGRRTEKPNESSTRPTNANAPRTQREERSSRRALDDTKPNTRRGPLPEARWGTLSETEDLHKSHAKCAARPKVKRITKTTQGRLMLDGCVSNAIENTGTLRWSS